MFTLGISAGALLSAMVLPILVVTSIANASSSGSTIVSGVAIQQILPATTLAIPTTLPLVLAVLLLVGLIAQILMVCVVVRTSPSQSLRLNGD
jgi:F0F1-type ATP synthase assembly protein I